MVAESTFQRPCQVFPVIGGEECQDSPRLVSAIAARTNQFFQKHCAIPTQLGEAFLQPLVLLLLIASRGVLRQCMFLARDSRRVERVPCDLIHIGCVDDQLGFRDPYWQQLSDSSPRHGVEVLPIDDATLAVHHAVDDQSGVIRFRGKIQ